MQGTLDIAEAAAKAAGNWKRFDSFVWFRDRELEDADQWSVIYTHNRDSRLLDQSNAQVITKAMESFTEGDDPDVVFESHSHWAVGHVDGFSVRVFIQLFASLWRRWLIWHTARLIAELVTCGCELTSSLKSNLQVSLYPTMQTPKKNR